MGTLREERTLAEQSLEDWELDLPARFEVQRKLGRGSFGLVRLCFDTRLGRHVAVKMPRNEAVNQRIFLAEAHNASQLDHASIVRIYDASEHEGHVYIVCEYVEGNTLSQWRLREPHSLLQIVEIMTKIAEAIEHAHTKGVIHRDLKPGNVLVDNDGNPKILDFGLSRSLERSEDLMTAGSNRVGTPAYMAPELFCASTDPSGVKSDVYALGVMFFQLVSSQLPHTGSVSEIRHRLLQQQESPHLRERTRSIPKAIDAICHQAMAKDPAERYATAQAFADDLSNYLQGGPLKAYAGLYPRRCRRVLRKATPVAVILLLVLVALSAIFWGYRQYLADSPQLPVALATQPPGLPLAWTRFDPDTGLLDEASTLRSSGGSAAWLEPGFYRVVVRNGEAFKEVFRSVPASLEAATVVSTIFREQKIQLPHRSAARKDGVCQVPAVVCGQEKVQRERALHAGGKVRIKSSSTGVPMRFANQSQVVESFAIDTTEISWADLRATWPRIEIAEATDRNRCATKVPWDVAVAWCEKNDCNLPSVWELTWAATNRGKTQFPAGDKSPSIYDDQDPLQVQFWDRTQSKPPVLGLITGASEWTCEPFAFLKPGLEGDWEPLSMPGEGPAGTAFPRRLYAVLNLQERVLQLPTVPANLAFQPAWPAAGVKDAAPALGFRTVKRTYRFPD